MMENPMTTKREREEGRVDPRTGLTFLGDHERSIR
jgi:hypothetical protein